MVYHSVHLMLLVHISSRAQRDRLVDRENATSILVGGEQEKGRRGGTENYPAIVSASVAWETHLKRTLDIPLLAGFRNHFEKQMENLFPGVKFIGKSSPRLWNTSLYHAKIR